MERADELRKKSNEASVKHQLMEVIDEREFDKWVQDKKDSMAQNANTQTPKSLTDKNIKINDSELVEIYKFAGNRREWSIAELIKEFNIPRSTVENIINECNQNDNITYEYNLDLIYTEDARIDFMIENNIDAVVIDAMYSTSDGIFKDDIIYEMVVEKISSDEIVTTDDLVILD